MVLMGLLKLMSIMDTIMVREIRTPTIGVVRQTAALQGEKTVVQGVQPIQTIQNLNEEILSGKLQAVS